MARLYRNIAPKDVRENVLYRRNLYEICRKSEVNRRAVIEMCRRDPIFWIDSFVWQFNPNSIGSSSLDMGPFITWEYQERAIEKINWCIATRRDLVIEKSRELGASWICLLVMVHPLLFSSWKKYLCISHNELSVDDHSPDSLFWKIDFILDYLPDWMKPKITRRDLFFGSENNVVISGQATTKRAGVGGRANAMFCDEFSQIKDAYDIIDRTSNTTKCRIFNGTHLGTGTAFYELTNPDSMIGKYVQKLQMHWTDHPDKNKGCYHYDPKLAKIVTHDPEFDYTKCFNYDPVTGEKKPFEFDHSGLPTGGPKPGVRSPYYDDECRRKTRQTAIAMDLDIDPQRSVEQLFDPVIVNSLIGQYAKTPRWQGNATIEEGELKLTKHPKGSLKLWLTMDTEDKAPADDYFFGFDNAHGVQATPTCGSACNSRGEKIFQWQDYSLDPKETADLFLLIFEMFRNKDKAYPMIAWEVPGPGKVFGDRLMASGYRRIYMRQDKDFARKKKAPAPGWLNDSNGNAKMPLIVNYRDALKARQYINPDAGALKDCLNFRFVVGGKIEHSGEKSDKDLSGARQNHGDIVIADALSLKILLASGKLVTTPVEHNRTHVPVGSRKWRELYSQMDDKEKSWSES